MSSSDTAPRFNESMRSMILYARVQSRSSSIGFFSATTQECGCTIISMPRWVGAPKSPNPSWCIPGIGPTLAALPRATRYYMLCTATSETAFHLLMRLSMDVSGCLEGLKRVALWHPVPAHPVNNGTRNPARSIVVSLCAYVVPRPERRSEGNL